METRLHRLERELRLWRAGFGIVSLIVLAAVGLPAQTSDPKILRVRGLIIEDEQGRERMAIGSPVPDPKDGKRRTPVTGIVINDAAGFERFGLGVREDGSVGMGFDAPPGTGDPRNRERINIVADARGGAYIRFLNRKTFATGFLRLDDKDQFYLEFNDFPDGKVVRRRIGFKGDEVIEEKR